MSDSPITPEKLAQHWNALCAGDFDSPPIEGGWSDDLNRFMVRTVFDNDPSDVPRSLHHLLSHGGIGESVKKRHQK